MLTFFRLNDPYRLIVIFLLLLVMRFPALFNAEELTVPELNYMLIGEKLAEGSKLYSGIWDDMAPLSAVVYGLIDLLFGRSSIACTIIAWLILCFQVFLFNRLVLFNKVYNENTYIPGFIYGLMMSFFSDFFILTPVLMATTFLLLALNNIFRHIEVRVKRDERILNIGLFLGIAYLFHFPILLMGAAALLIFILFTGTVTRRYLMLLYGFLLPLLLMSFYFVFTGRWQDFVYCVIQPLFFGLRHWYVTTAGLLIIFSVPLLYLFMSFYKMSSDGRYTNYQARLNQAMFVWLIFSLGSVFLNDANTPNAYAVVVPVFAYYFSHFFLTIRRRLWAEILFSLLVVALVFVNYGSTYGFATFMRPSYFEDYFIKASSHKEFEGKKILVLGSDIRAYHYAKSATPFLNWDISRKVLERPDYYDNLTVILKGFQEDMPEIILDPHSIMPQLMDRILPLAKNYQEKAPGRYELISN